MPITSSNFHSVSALSNAALKRFTFTIVLIVTMAAKTWAQELPSQLIQNNQKVHWHKYTNREFGFSFSYPDTYRPTPDPECGKGNEYRRWLLCLERRDDPKTTILVTIVTAVPFFIKTDRGDDAYTRQEIGQHLFYCGLGGSMGVGFSDECTFDLKGKTLEFNFSPAETINSGHKTNFLMFKSLKTFRTF
jgi:hypothetical protein